MSSVCEQQFSSFATDSQLDLGLDFAWAILTHLICFVLNQLIVALAVRLGLLSCGGGVASTACEQTSYHSDPEFILS